MLASLSIADESALEVVMPHVVREFPNVFSEDLFNLPPVVRSSSSST